MDNIVIKMYVTECRSMSSVSKFVGKDIRYFLNKNNIKIRSAAEQKLSDKRFGRKYNFGCCDNPKGKRNSQYKHGKMVGQKANRKIYLDAVANRKWECEKCFVTKTNDNFDLVVHHIDHDNENHSDNNLMILCQGCHTKIHFEDGSFHGRPRIVLDNNKIVDLYCNQGMSLTDIGVIFNVAYNTIRMRLISQNIKIRTFSQQHKLDHKIDNINLIINDYKKGYMISELVKKYVLSYIIISKLLKNNNVVIRTQIEQSIVDLKNQFTYEEISKVCNMYNKKIPIKIITNTMNISVRKMKTILLRFNNV